MKFVTRFAFIAGLIVAAVQFSGCLNDDNKIPPNCYDGILNNDEELVDCGGPNCPACDPCENGIWEPELGEQWVDCGGDCPPCDIHFNGQLDPGEECIDCGGITGVDCGELCDDGLPNGCEEDIDCGGPYCEACPSCEDEVMNGLETGIDCGGPECQPCPEGVNCTNGILDIFEQYIDCGGPYCNPCQWYFRWRANNTNREADFDMGASLNGTTLILAGVSTAPANIMAILPEPVLLGWQNNSNVEVSPNNFPEAQVVYQDAQGVTFSSQFDGSQVTFSFVFLTPFAGGVARGTFSGTLFSEAGTSVNISNGEYFLEIE